MLKRRKKEEKLLEVIEILFSNSSLPAKYKDHQLKGCYEGSRELHIEPDWLLIYRIERNALILERTGTHSDLFK